MNLCNEIKGHHFQPGFNQCDCGHFKIITYSSASTEPLKIFTQFKMTEVLDNDPKDEVIKVLKEALVWYTDRSEVDSEVADKALAAVEKLENDK